MGDYFVYILLSRRLDDSTIFSSSTFLPRDSWFGVAVFHKTCGGSWVTMQNIVRYWRGGSNGRQTWTYTAHTHIHTENSVHRYSGSDHQWESRSCKLIGPNHCSDYSFHNLLIIADFSSGSRSRSFLSSVFAFHEEEEEEWPGSSEGCRPPNLAQDHAVSEPDEQVEGGKQRAKA